MVPQNLRWRENKCYTVKTETEQLSFIKHVVLLLILCGIIENLKLGGFGSDIFMSPISECAKTDQLLLRTYVEL